MVRLDPLLRPVSSYDGNVAVLNQGECDFLLTYAHETVPLMSDPARFTYRRLGPNERSRSRSPTPMAGRVHAIRPTGEPIRYLSYGSGSFFGHRLVKLFVERPCRPCHSL